MFNPSPIIGHQEFPWHLVDYLIINRGELDRTLESISPAVLDRSSALEARMDALLAHYPNMVIMVTLGPDGVALLSKDYRLRLPAGVLSSDVKDTVGPSVRAWYLLITNRLVLATRALATLPVSSQEPCLLLRPRRLAKKSCKTSSPSRSKRRPCLSSNTAQIQPQS